MATRINWTDKGVDDKVTMQDLNDLATALRGLADAISAEHSLTDGSHDDPKIAVGWGHVSESSGTYTLEDNKGLVSSIAKQATGHVRVTLSASLQDDGGGNYYYIVVPYLIGEPGQIQVTALTATTFDIKTYDPDGTAADRAFGFTVYGEPV